MPVVAPLTSSTFMGTLRLDTMPLLVTRPSLRLV